MPTTADRLDNLATTNLGLVGLAGLTLAVIGTAWTLRNRPLITAIAVDGVDTVLHAIAAIPMPSLPAAPWRGPVYDGHHRLHNTVDPAADSKPWRTGCQEPAPGRGAHWAIGTLHDTGLFPIINPAGETAEETTEVNA